jgi:hypothetical protein
VPPEEDTTEVLNVKLAGLKMLGFCILAEERVTFERAFSKQIMECADEANRQTRIGTDFLNEVFYFCRKSA